MSAVRKFRYPVFCIAENTIYFSGVGALKEDGTLVEGGFRQHAEQAFRNIDVALKKAGVTKAHIVRIVARVAHISYLPMFEEVYDEFLVGYDENLPARSFGAGEYFPFDSLVEIEVTANFEPVRQDKFVPTPDEAESTK